MIPMSLRETCKVIVLDLEQKMTRGGQLSASEKMILRQLKDALRRHGGSK